MAKEESEQGGQIPVESPIIKDNNIHSNDSQMMYSTFFRFYDYEAQDGWVSRNKQLKDAGLDTSGIEIVNGKGVSNNGQYSQYNESEGEYMSYSEQLASLGIDESEYELTFGKGYAKANGKETKPSCLTFTAVEDNSSVGFRYWVGPAPGTSPDLGKNMEYSLDNGKTWETYTIVNDSNINYINLEHVGDSVMFRGNNETLCGEGGMTKCELQGKVAASGDITSLLNGIGGDIPIPENCFNGFFYSLNGLTSVPNLPSAQLSRLCYSGMFRNCSSLTKAPVLPATQLADSCYQQMFLACTSLTEAPVLPAKTLVSNCYRMMFYGCSSLTKVTCLATDISAGNCTDGWLNGVSQTGTFTKASGMNDWTTGEDGIPSGWTVENI